MQLNGQSLHAETTMPHPLSSMMFEVTANGHCLPAFTTTTTITITTPRTVPPIMKEPHIPTQCQVESNYHLHTTSLPD